MRRKTTIERNREIFANYQAGQTTKHLAQTYGLNRHTVIAIIGTERHRLEVSIDEFYEGQRALTGLHTSDKS
jgi:Mor family transcriptional regulator